jgi:hypothetical protein
VFLHRVEARQQTGNCLWDGAAAKLPTPLRYWRAAAIRQKAHDPFKPPRAS